jgi:tetratricopeptide (TPR) repeat protein
MTAHVVRCSWAPTPGINRYNNDFMTDGKPKIPKISPESVKARGEEAYTRAMLLHSVGKKEESMVALDEALNLGYPPAILTAGSVQYQCEQQAKGKKLLMSLTALPPETEQLFEIIEEAGAFLLSINENIDAFELYQMAVEKFPDVPAFHQRFGQCAAQEERFDDAIAAGQRAIDLDPENAVFISDFGWTLTLAGRYQEAETAFMQALELDASNENARLNLEYCRDKLSQLHAAEPAKAAPKKKARKKRTSGRG